MPRQIDKTIFFFLKKKIPVILCEIAGRSLCKRLSDLTGNSFVNMHVFDPGSCHQQGYLAVSRRTSHGDAVQNQS